MSQHTAQQVIGIRNEKSVETNEFPVTIEISKDSKEFYRGRENSVVIELTG